MPDGSQMKNPEATSHFLWNAVQRRVLSYLLAQQEVDPGRIGAKGYSYGGTIMWNLGMDPRVKAIKLYFGIGWINYYRDRAVWMHNNPYREPEKTSDSNCTFGGGRRRPMPRISLRPACG